MLFYPKRPNAPERHGQFPLRWQLTVFQFTDLTVFLLKFLTDLFHRDVMTHGL